MRIQKLSEAFPPNMSSTYFNTQYVKQGSSAQEKCQADGYPKPTYIWKKDGVDMSTDAQYEINSNTGDIKIKNVTAASGEGTYQCFAQNSQGTALSGFWEVRVAYLNGFRKAKTTSPTVNEYSYYSLPCKYQPSSVPASKLDWLVGAGDHTTFPTTPEDKRRIVQDPNGNLHFLFVRISDMAYNPYRCQLFNDIVSTKAVSLEKFNLNVLRGSEVTSKPILKYSKSVEGTIGLKAALLCIFAGYPIPNVKWYKDGVGLPDTSLPDGTQRYKIDPEDSTGRKLIISNLEIKDEGDYICRATNAYGTNEGTVQVMVTGPPQWNIEPLTSTRIPVGETAIFNCNTVSYHANSSLPMWMKNGEPIIGYDLEKVTGNRFHFSANSTQLNILNVLENDTMCIQCRVHNYRREYSPNPESIALIQNQEYSPNPEPGIMGTTFGNACLKVVNPNKSANAALISGFIALFPIIIILLIIAFIVWYLYRNYAGKKEHQAGHDREQEKRRMMDTLV